MFSVGLLMCTGFSPLLMVDTYGLIEDYQNLNQAVFLLKNPGQKTLNR
jgi:hypothetical protein